MVDFSFGRHQYGIHSRVALRSLYRRRQIGPGCPTVPLADWVAAKFSSPVRGAAYHGGAAHATKARRLLQPKLTLHKQGAWGYSGKGSLRGCRLLPCLVSGSMTTQFRFRFPSAV